MTIDEAIEHAREKSEEQRKDYDTCVVKEGYGCKDCAYYYSKPCIECAEEHEQLARWLEELKDYRRFNGTKTFDNGFKQGEKYGYNKAIDDLTEKISKYRTYDDWGNVINVLKIAEELKDHKTLNIVHCKDCKHWGTGVAGETENVKCCEYGKYMVGDNGYCVYGEKKECAE